MDFTGTKPRRTLSAAARNTESTLSQVSLEPGGASTARPSAEIISLLERSPNRGLQGDVQRRKCPSHIPVSTRPICLKDSAFSLDSATGPLQPQDRKHPI